MLGLYSLFFLINFYECSTRISNTLSIWRDFYTTRSGGWSSPVECLLFYKNFLSSKVLKEALLSSFYLTIYLLVLADEGFSRDLDSSSPKIGSYLGVFAVELLLSSLFLGVVLDDLEIPRFFLLLDFILWDFSDFSSYFPDSMF